MYSKGGKNTLALFLLILGGIVLGGFIGHYLGDIQYFEWLKFGETFGFKTPFVLDFGVLSLTLGFAVRINVASIIGIIIAIFVYRRI